MPPARQLMVTPSGLTMIRSMRVWAIFDCSAGKNSSPVRRQLS
jgi:hypothetical protein